MCSRLLGCEALASAGPVSELGNPLRIRDWGLTHWVWADVRSLNSGTFADELTAVQ